MDIEEDSCGGRGGVVSNDLGHLNELCRRLTDGIHRAEMFGSDELLCGLHMPGG